jgi:hypothetical protein
MTNLDSWKNDMQEYAKLIPYRTFSQQIGSWYPIMLTKRAEGITRYTETTRSPNIISNQQFHANIDSNLSYGRDYDFSKNFFENFQQLFLTIPLPCTMDVKWDNENSNFADTVSSSKNVYLSWNVTNCNENVLYSLGVKEHGRNIFNSVMTWDNSENIYMSSGIVSSHTVQYSRYIYNSSNIFFSANMIWCHDCFLCTDLENASYCVENKQYSKEEYTKLQNEFLKQKNQYMLWYDSLPKQWRNYGSADVQGNYTLHSHNIEHGNYIYHMKSSRNLLLGGYSYGIENIYNGMFVGSKNNCYNVLGCGSQAEEVYNSIVISGWANIFYSILCIEGCSYCLWCIGLKNKHFCIFNKEYTKEEWFILVDKIFSQMQTDGILWQFFPWWINPFYFNDTIAYLLDDSFTKEEVSAKWYLRRDDPIKVDIPSTAEVITTKDIYQYQWFTSDWNRKINLEILKKVIRDEKWNYYRIVPMELEFLQKHWLPLPDIHRLDRIKLGFKFK